MDITESQINSTTVLALSGRLDGLTSPILSRFPWQHMPRPVLPIDDTAEWTLPA